MRLRDSRHQYSRDPQVAEPVDEALLSQLPHPLRTPHILPSKCKDFCCSWLLVLGDPAGPILQERGSNVLSRPPGSSSTYLMSRRGGHSRLYISSQSTGNKPRKNVSHWIRKRKGIANALETGSFTPCTILGASKLNKLSSCRSYWWSCQRAMVSMVVELYPEVFGLAYS